MFHTVVEHDNRTKPLKTISLHPFSQLKYSTLLKHNTLILLAGKIRIHSNIVSSNGAVLVHARTLRPICFKNLYTSRRSNIIIESHYAVIENKQLLVQVFDREIFIFKWGASFKERYSTVLPSRITAFCPLEELDELLIAQNESVNRFSMNNFFELEPFTLKQLDEGEIISMINLPGRNQLAIGATSIEATVNCYLFLIEHKTWRIVGSRLLNYRGFDFDFRMVQYVEETNAIYGIRKFTNENLELEIDCCKWEIFGGSQCNVTERSLMKVKDVNWKNFVMLCKGYKDGRTLAFFGKLTYAEEISYGKLMLTDKNMKVIKSVDSPTRVVAFWQGLNVVVFQPGSLLLQKARYVIVNENALFNNKA